MTFHDVRFPTGVSWHSIGGPERKTDIVALASGHEERNSPWAHSRRRFQAGYGVRSLNDLHEVIAFFEARHGRLYGFRWKDPVDFKSCPPQDALQPTDQDIGVGDGSTSEFTLVKTYRSGAQSYLRPIQKPVVGTCRIAVNGIEVTGADVDVDADTGRVSFAPQAIPALNAPITAGFEFDVPARFDTDSLQIDLAAFNAGDIPNIPIVEIKA